MYTAPTPPLDAVGFGSEQFLLLVRGWRDSKSRLRIAFRSSDLELNAFCTVLEAREGRVAFWIGAERDKNAVDFVVAECFCGFRDVPLSESELPVGVEIESMIGAVRDDFSLLIMLLK